MGKPLYANIIAWSNAINIPAMEPSIYNQAVVAIRALLETVLPAYRTHIRAIPIEVYEPNNPTATCYIYITGPDTITLVNLGVPEELTTRRMALTIQLQDPQAAQKIKQHILRAPECPVHSNTSTTA